MSYYAFIVVVLTISTNFLHTTNAHAHTCYPRKPLIGKRAPPGQCDPSGAERCKPGFSYTTYRCSPPVTKHTHATLTRNSFEEGGDGGGKSACYDSYHSDDTHVVALSTGWYKPPLHPSRCGKEIVISGNGKTTRAKVVDKCDSMRGCDKEHGYQGPCKNNVVDASKAVWKAIGVSPNSALYGKMPITWSDA